MPIRQFTNGNNKESMLELITSLTTNSNLSLSVSPLFSPRSRTLLANPRIAQQLKPQENE